MAARLNDAVGWGSPGTPSGPRLAVLLCMHNGARFLPQQLESLVQQEWPPCCVFIHDWASRDDSLAIARRGEDAAPVGCVWQVVAHDHAPGAARSFLSATLRCLDASVAFDYLLFCDQDDVWHPAKLRTFAELIGRQPGLDLIYSDVELIDETGALLSPTYLRSGGAFGRPMDVLHPSTLFVNTVSGMSMAMSRSFLERGRTAWQSPDWFMHDWAMTIFACLTRAQVAFIPQSLVSYRQHAGNLIGGSGGHRGRRRLLSILKQAKADVLKVHRQYSACASFNVDTAPPPTIGRLKVAWTILQGRSFRPLKRLKVAAGYALLWPGRG